MHLNFSFTNYGVYVRPFCASAVLIVVLGANNSQAFSLVNPDGVAENKSLAFATDKKVITHHAYANWRSIANTVMSRDGQWAAYAQVAQEADGEVVFSHVGQAKKWRFPRGANPVFSADGKYAAFAIKPTQLQIDQARKEKKKGDDLLKSDLGIVDLLTGQMETIKLVKQFSWPAEGGDYLAVLMEPKPTEKKELLASKDSDVDIAEDQEVTSSTETKKKRFASEFVIIDVQNHVQKNIAHVTNFSWAKNGSVIAFDVQHPLVSKDIKDTNEGKLASKGDAEVVLSSTNKPLSQELSDGAYVLHPQDLQPHAILIGSGSYKGLCFNEDGSMLAFISNRDEIDKNREKTASNNVDKKTDKKVEKESLIYQLFYWQTGQEQAQLLASADTKGMPPSWGVSEFGELTFSKDGQRLFFSTAELPKVEQKGDEEIVKVDLWHWQDAELQSVQKVNAEKDKNKHFLAVMHLADHRFVQLATPQIPYVVVNENADVALGTSDIAYKMLSSWDGNYQDAYAIHLQTGQSSLIAKKLRFTVSLSPAGKYMLSFDAVSSNWLAWSTQNGKEVNLTKKIKTHFEDQEHDTPEPRSPFGLAGWRADDHAVIVYDQFDLWEINPQTQENKNLTNGYGRQHQLQLKYLALDEDSIAKAEEAMPIAEHQALPEQTWILTATHQKNRSMGFFQLDAHGGTPEQLILAKKMLGSVLKAKQADTILFTQQSFTEFPDLWRTDLHFQHPIKISSANPQQSRYNWGTQEMITYTTKDGKKLNALLAKPENFDPSKKYPLMVYIYEKLSDNLHRYIPPAPSQNINVTRYVSNGYIVLRPDIVYQTGHPGKSAMNAVIPAINQVLALGYVDPKRIGIQGHSWGAYQIDYMLTQTTMFKAAEAGAAVADMVSGYGGIRWGKGVSRAFQYETGQSRIGGMPWNKTEQYIENSAIFHIDKIQTPYLTKHNDGDDAVPWYQAIEFFTAMRRLGKEAYWFNYNGEKHGLKDKENIKHYTVHLDEYFDYFLLGQPRPDWMKTPIPYLERGRRDVNPLFTPDAIDVVLPPN